VIAYFKYEQRLTDKDLETKVPLSGISLFKTIDGEITEDKKQTLLNDSSLPQLLSNTTSMLEGMGKDYYIALYVKNDDPNKLDELIRIGEKDQGPKEKI